MAKRVKAKAKRVTRTVGGYYFKLRVEGDEGEGAISHSYVSQAVLVTRVIVHGVERLDESRINLNRSETRALRDALTRILGDGE